MRSVDVAIIGCGMRGLWLSTELARIGWSVTWIQIEASQYLVHENEKKSDLQNESVFEYDDWPWQVGPNREHSKLIQLAGKFISEVIQPEVQEIATQILTLKGPLELSGGLEDLALRKFFPQSFNEISRYLESIRDSQKLNEKRASQLVSAHAKKIFDRPLGERWVLEWLGSLRRSRVVSSKEWVSKWSGEILDPKSSFWLLKDSLAKTVERGISWAEKQGVTVHRNAKLVGIDVNSRKISGLVFDGAEGFVQTGRVVFSCSYQTVERIFPKFAREISNPLKKVLNPMIWIRCGFKLKKNSKPHMLGGFSSFVMDPLMPLNRGNLGLLRWKTLSQSDALTVWIRVVASEVKRKSFLDQMEKSISNSLSVLFPHFSKNLISTVGFEDYLLKNEFTHDDVPFVFEAENPFRSQSTRIKNAYLAGPGFDRGLELLSQLGTELRLLEKLAVIRMKELPRDRTLHPPRNGQGLGGTKQI
jgi:hypothetical protein